MFFLNLFMAFSWFSLLLGFVTSTLRSSGQKPDPKSSQTSGQKPGQKPGQKNTLQIRANNIIKRTNDSSREVDWCTALMRQWL